MSGRLVALGDSFSCGIGVGVTTPRHATWVGLLASALGVNAELHACPGMASGEVLRDQVPSATVRRAELATVLVGLNDVVRTAFDPAATGANLHAIIDQLGGAHDVVLVARLHNPVTWLPIPHRMRRHYVSRIADVNAALDDAVVERSNVVVLRLDEIPALRARCAWAVDRIHPSRYGHHVVARAALEALRDYGAADAMLAETQVPDAPPSLLGEIRWFARHGGPWLARRLPNVVSGRVASGPQYADDVVEPPGGRRPTRSEQLVDR